MEITTIQRANACFGMSTFGPAVMGSVVPSYGPLTDLSVKPRQHSNAGNGGERARDAWGPPV